MSWPSGAATKCRRAPSLHLQTTSWDATSTNFNCWLPPARRLSCERNGIFQINNQRIGAPADALAIISALEDHFFPVTTLTDVISLYDFDVRLRTATFDALGPVELSLWALHGHELGEVDECAHLKLDLLGPRAKGKPYEIWLEKYTKKLGRSHEDCVSHHQDSYDGVLPVWAAVEIVDLGSLRYPFGFSPRSVQDRIADQFGLSAPQLESWTRALEKFKALG